MNLHRAFIAAGAVVALSALQPNIAQAAVANINFDNITIPPINQVGPLLLPLTYGSTANVSANWAQPAGNPGVRLWDVGYGTLTNVIYIGDTAPQSLPLTVTFTAAAGTKITGYRFDAAHFLEADDNSNKFSYSVTGNSGAYTGFNGSANASLTTFSTFSGGFGAFGPLDSLTLKFGPENYYIGFDNFQIEFTAAPVPLPGTLALIFAGLGIVGSTYRRRAKASN